VAAKEMVIYHVYLHQTPCITWLCAAVNFILSSNIIAFNIERGINYRFG